jgi:hypothetical protein
MTLQVKRFNALKSSGLEAEMNKWLSEWEGRIKIVSEFPAVFYLSARNEWYCFLWYKVNE